jgi:hypothetical protein
MSKRRAQPVAAPAVAPAPEAETLPAQVRYFARVRIHAGVTYEPGQEIPERVALDGFTEGKEYDCG